MCSDLPYCVQELDLNNPKTFRNLSKPMGAQTDDRLIQYKKRFKDWEDPNGGFRQQLLSAVIYLVDSWLKYLTVCLGLGETPAYHYGTHYSSAMIVASYLVRMEPFTQIFLRLQVSFLVQSLLFILLTNLLLLIRLSSFFF